MKRIIRLTESELTNLVSRVVNEMKEDDQSGYIEMYHMYKDGDISQGTFYRYMSSLEKHERQSLIDYIESQKEMDYFMNEEYESVYTDSNEEISYDIQSVDCGGDFGGSVDIDEDDTIVIRYCEGDDEELEYLKEKGKRLLYRKYGM